tara:strand:+ start:2347 stop:2670 length:324 start_codon:yes stop_codon:yes gene_type:complete
MSIKISSKGNYIYVKGSTYHITHLLKENQFGFDPVKKQWYRFGFDPNIYYKLASIINSKPNSIRPIIPDEYRCIALCNNGFRCKLHKRKEEYCKVHDLKYNHDMAFL